MKLDDRDCAVLAFEREWWRLGGAKEQAIADLFDLTPTRYYAELDKLIDRAETLEHDPLLVHRLQRIRASRARRRAG